MQNLPQTCGTVIKNSWWAGVHALEMDLLPWKKDLWRVFMYCMNDIHCGLHLAMMLFIMIIIIFNL